MIKKAFENSLLTLDSSSLSKIFSNGFITKESSNSFQVLAAVSM